MRRVPRIKFSTENLLFPSCHAPNNTPLLLTESYPLNPFLNLSFQLDHPWFENPLGLYSPPQGSAISITLGFIVSASVRIPSMVSQSIMPAKSNLKPSICYSVIQCLIDSMISALEYSFAVLI